MSSMISMNRTFRSPLLLLVVAALAVVAAACGDDDDDNAASFSEGDPVVCDQLANDSYRYTFVYQFTTDSPEPKPTNVVQGPTDAQFTQQITGTVEDNDSFMADISNEFGGGPTVYGVVKDNGRSWFERSADQWTEEELPEGRGGTVIPMLPVNLCIAIAPDIDTSAGGVSEDVGGIDSLRYDVAPLTSDFPDRSQDFGPQSDVAALINDFNGSVWVAESGGYISKMELTGTGTYPDGTVLDIRITYEISDVGSEIDVDPPI
jgi:hypothetical protein